MALSLKAELETWMNALSAYDVRDYDGALALFAQIADSSKIHTNMGLIYATIGEHQAAVEQFIAATNLDQYLAVAYFQCGVSNFLLTRYELALKDFTDALLYLRGNQAIDYEQIGLKFKLYSAEVIFNIGLSRIYLGDDVRGLADLQDSAKEKATDEHAVIDDAIRDRGDGYTVFSIPVGVLYRPSESKVKNSKTKDYMGKAKLVAASDADDAFTTFSGVTRLKQSMAQAEADDRPRERESPRDRDPPRDREPREWEPPRERKPQREPTREPTREPREWESPRGRQEPLGDPREAPREAGRELQRVREPSRPREPPSPGLARNTTVSIPRSEPLVRAGPSSPQTRPLEPFGARPSIRRTHAPSQSVSIPSPVSPTRTRSNTTTTTTTTGGLSRSASSVAPRTAAIGRSPSILSRAPFVLPPVNSPANDIPVITPAAEPGRMTTFYDDYINSYADAPASRPPLPPIPATPLDDSPLPLSVFSQDIRPIAYTRPTTPKDGVTSNLNGYSPGGGPLRRKVTRRATQRRAYDEGQEDYGTGEYDDGPFELTKIKVKLHYQGDVRGMTLTPELSFEEFVERITTKFSTAMDGLGLQFKDEDGGRITLRDDSDYELAIETARDSARGKPEGKLEVWCTDR